MEVYKITISFDGNKPVHQEFVMSALYSINHIFIKNDYSKEIDRSFIHILVIDLFDKGVITKWIKHINPEILVRKYTLSNMERVE